MKVHRIFFKNKLRNFSYLIDLGDGELICIDPFNDLEIIDYIKSKQIERLTKIVITHDHCDHHSGSKKLVDLFKIPVYAHQNAQIETKDSNLSDLEIIHQYNEWTLKAIYTPGHTLSHLSILLLRDNIPYAIFTGDCFFNAGVGNCYNGGDVEQLYFTIQNIFQHFPDEVLVYPGHEYLRRNLEFTNHFESKNQDAIDFLTKIHEQNLDEHFYTTDMKTEKKINLFLRLNSTNLQSSINLCSANNQSKEVFIRLRELRNQW